MSDRSERNRTLVAALVAVAALFLAIAGVGFALGAAQLAGVGHRMVDLVDPPVQMGPDRPAVVKSVRGLARLESAVLELEQRVVGERGKDGSWYWVGERIEFVARGEVTAGIDLGTLGDDDVWVDPDGTVHLRLPAAEIWRVDLDEDASFVEARERGWFGVSQVDFESQARREAVRLLREAAEQKKLPATAEKKAQDAVRRLLEQAGAPAVIFED